MSKAAFPITIAIALLLSVFCCRGPQMPAAASAVSPVSAAVPISPRAEDGPNGAELLRCLRELTAWPEATAGSSLRLALLLAELSDWAEADGSGLIDADSVLLSCLQELSASERALLLPRLEILRAFCASLTPQQLRAMQYDAGREDPPVMDPGRLDGLLRRLMETAAGMSMQKKPGKMNIHCGCHCRQDKSLL